MFGSTPRSAKAYASVGIETGVTVASPHQLIVMLYEGALIATNHALRAIAAGQIEAKGVAISKALMIIENGLRVSLNKEQGGDIATNLDALYEYMCNRLVIANLNSNATLIEEVQGLLAQLKSAWENIPPQHTMPTVADAVVASANAPAVGAPMALPNTTRPVSAVSSKTASLSAYLASSY